MFEPAFDVCKLAHNSQINPLSSLNGKAVGVETPSVPARPRCASPGRAAGPTLPVGSRRSCGAARGLEGRDRSTDVTLLSHSPRGRKRSPHVGGPGKRSPMNFGGSLAKREEGEPRSVDSKEHQPEHCVTCPGQLASIGACRQRQGNDVTMEWGPLGPLHGKVNFRILTSE